MGAAYLSVAPKGARKKKLGVSGLMPIASVFRRSAAFHICVHQVDSQNRLELGTKFL